MKKRRYFLAVFITILILAAFIPVIAILNNKPADYPLILPAGKLSPTPISIVIPDAKVLINNYYAKQTFNNCGPASLSMALSYYGINNSQDTLGKILRPYQHPTGDNDDKSVTLDELATLAQTYGLLTYHRPNGDVELLKKFISLEIPVITRTWLHIDEDIGHYRIIKGFDSLSQKIIQDDSYEGANLSFSYADFNTMWEKFDYEYLVLVPADKKEIAESVIGENLDVRIAWQKAVKRNKDKLTKNPNDIYSRFNLAVAYYYLKDYQKSIEEYEKVENYLPSRTLWYQREPIEAYFEVGNYEKVFSLTDKIINNYNRAYSELYILRGKIYQIQGKTELAKSEFQKAVYYNTNLKEAVEALTLLR